MNDKGIARSLRHFRVLLHLVRLPVPNLRLIAPPSPCPPGLCSYYIFWVPTAFMRLHWSSSWCRRRRQNAQRYSLHFYILDFEPLVLSAHNDTCVHLPWMYCKCSKEGGSQFLLKASRNSIFILSACSASVSIAEKKTHITSTLFVVCIYLMYEWTGSWSLLWQHLTLVY